MQRTAKDRFGIVAAFVLVIAANYLSNALPINGTTMSEISASYPTLFTPAGRTFAIWGVIYAFLTAFTIYQVLPGQKDSALLAKLSPLFILNCVFNAAWIVVWHYGYLWIALAIMLGILATLVLIYRHLRVVGAATSIGQKMCVYIPFSLYLGWITVATIANASIVQFDMGWNEAGMTALTWTYLKIAFAGTIGAFMVLRKGDIAFVLVIAWAASGIAAKQTGTPEVVGAATALTWGALFLAVVGGLKLLRPKSSF